jgi:EAL and modified HD-GYP domain-containing signal transduction protein
LQQKIEKQLLLARQPIFNTDVEIVAYELLFREFDPDQAKVVDGDHATSAVIINAFTNLDLGQLVGDCKAYINFTSNLLEMDLPIDPTRCVIEILEDIEITPKLLAQVERLKLKGHQIALDDFIYTPAAEPLLPMVDVIKLDLLALSEQQLDDMVERFQPLDALLLAEKVESQEMLDKCRQKGFVLFQGNFLSKPEPIEGKKMTANKLVVLDLLNRLQDPKSTMSELEKYVERDPVIGFKTMKLVNSAYYQPRHKIESLSRAMTYLGMDAMRSLASLLALAEMSDKPDALRAHALEKAKLCEVMGAKFRKKESAVFYSVGLLSSMDAYFDQPLPALVESMSLREDVKLALLEHAGQLGLILNTAENIQKGAFSEIDWVQLDGLGLRPAEINEMYLAVIEWQSNMVGDVFDQF